MKDRISNFLNWKEAKAELKFNFIDVIQYIYTSKESMSIVLLLNVVSTFFVCFGLNFDQDLIIYFGLLISPIIFSMIQLTVSIYKAEWNFVFHYLLKLILHCFLVILMAVLYFWVTPYSIYSTTIQQWSSLDIPFMGSTLLLILSLPLFNRMKLPLFLWILKILTKWTVWLVAAGYYLYSKDISNVVNLISHTKLMYLIVFIGIIALLFLYGIERKKEGNSWFWLSQLIVILWTIVGVLWIGKEVYSQTTDYNVKCYLENELESKSFHIHNYLVDKNTKEVVVYYSGIRPTKTQDEELKKLFHLSGYHMDFKEFK